VDLEAGTLRREPGTTNNDAGRVVCLTAELTSLLAHPLERVRALGFSQGVEEGMLGGGMPWHASTRPLEDCGPEHGQLGVPERFARCRSQDIKPARSLIATT
jgi:hypothetical protein